MSLGLVNRRPSRHAERNAEKKRELASHAMSALAELGFARINLRDIAARSGVSLGVIHYYFEDKVELLICCVSLYKEGFVRQLDELIQNANDAAQLRSSFAEALMRAVQDDARTHRLWYDARAQALFDPAFASVVDDVEAQLVRVVERLLARLRTFEPDMRPPPPGDSLGTYLLVDAWFRYAMQRHLAGDASAAAVLCAKVESALDSLCPAPARTP